MSKDAKKLKTREELLEYVKQSARDKRANTPIGDTRDDDATTVITSANPYIEDRRPDQYTRQATPGIHGRAEIDARVESGSSTVDGDTGESGTATTGDNGSTYQRDERPTADTTTSSTYYTTQPVKKRGNIVSRYRQAFKDARGTKKEEKPKRAKLFTDAEIREKRADLIEVILIQSDNLDQFIIATTKGHDRSIAIWSTIDRDDATFLANYMLKRAKKDERTAAAVRALIEMGEHLRAVGIVGPRTYYTFVTYMQKGIGIH